MKFVNNFNINQIIRRRRRSRRRRRRRKRSHLNIEKATNERVKTKEFCIFIILFLTSLHGINHGFTF